MRQLLGSSAPHWRNRKRKKETRQRFVSYQVFHYDLDQRRLPVHTRRWWPKALATYAVLGGIYGAAVGSAIGTVPSAVEIIEIAAATFALICGVPGTRLGLLIGIVTRNRFCKLFLGMFFAIAGALLGGFLATMILLALGAILGALGGWVLARAIIALRHGILRRFLFGVAAAVLGMFVGAMLWAINLNRVGALIGMAWGFAIGVVVGPILLLMVIGAMNSLAKTHISKRMEKRSEVVDATFRRED